MPRARNLKPGFFTNDRLAECDPLARLLFAGLWTIADREGRLEDRPRKIKAELLPYDDCEAEALLVQLADRGFIERYEGNGTQLIQVVNFGKHQAPHVKEAASQWPSPGQSDTSTMQAPDEHGEKIPSSVNPLPLPESLIPSPPSVAVLANGAASPPASEAHRLFSLYCDLTTIDQSEVPKATRDRQHSVFAQLLTKYEAGDVEGCMNWLRTWRAVPWKPESLWKEIDSWILENRPANGKRQARPKEPPVPRPSSSGVVSRSDGERQRQLIGR